MRSAAPLRDDGATRNPGHLANAVEVDLRHREIDPAGRVFPGATHSYHVRPFENSRLEPASLQVNKIDPWHPLRPAIDEADALHRIFREVRAAIRVHGCRRAVLVGHNAAFDLTFLNAAVKRTGLKRNPFHPFSCFDTATLGGAIGCAMATWGGGACSVSGGGAANSR